MQDFAEYSAESATQEEYEWFWLPSGSLESRKANWVVDHIAVDPVPAGGMVFRCHRLIRPIADYDRKYEETYGLD